MTDSIPPSLPTTPVEGSYESPRAALNSVQAWYNARTTALSERSVELSYAIIGANWAVFGSAGKILSSPYAKLSIGLILLFLALNLSLTRLLVELLRKRYFYAEGNPSRWAQEFEQNKGKAVAWPSTNMIDGIARALREVRTWFPLLAGGTLLVGILRSPT